MEQNYTRKNVVFIDRKSDIVKYILGPIKKTAALTTEEEHSLWLKMQDGDKEARQQLITANLAYVITIAKKYYRSKVRFEDLMQAGFEGLVNAVDKFDASLGFRLISYATWYIENEVRKAAYNYIKHKALSLDEADIDNEEDGITRADKLRAHSYQSTDWNLRYRDALEALKQRVEDRQSGLGHLVGHLHEMLQKGFTTSDFARRHRLNEQQMKRLLTILREEALPSSDHHFTAFAA